MSENDYILEMQDICKTFPGVTALDNAILKVKKGTVHGVMGENGAGKSTLMKVLLGLYKQDSGKIFFKGQEIYFRSINDALNSGIAMIHQELSLVMELTVTENIFLGKEITVGKTFINNKKQMAKYVRKLSEQLEIDIDPNVKIKYLSIAKQQMCEIMKAISYNASLLIMDEPTSAITENEVIHLFKIIRNLLKKGITIIYITHKMDEVFSITDEISVYRDGKYIDTVNTKETSRDQLIKLMVGRKITELFPKEYAKIGTTILKVDGLTRKGEFENISFELRRGEILGVAGLMGAGRSEIMETLFGIRKKTSGDIYINGNKIRIKNPIDSIKNKIALLTEDRRRSGCFMPLTVLVNTCITSISKYGKGIFVNLKDAFQDANNMKNILNIKTPSLEQKILNLSGGNQQKVIVGRWLLTEPDILIVDEPTRGIDVGAKAEIHKLLCSLAKQGKAIIMVSSELPEVLGISDRIMVISSGKLVGFIDAKDASQDKVLLYATGKTK